MFKPNILAFSRLYLFIKVFSDFMRKVSNNFCESPSLFSAQSHYELWHKQDLLFPTTLLQCALYHFVLSMMHLTQQEWALKRVLAAHVHMCPANEWQFAFTASIFTAHTFTQVFFCCDYFFCLAYMCRNFPMNFKLCEFLSRRRFLADESYILINLPPSTYAAQSSSPLSWALGSEQEVTQALLQHSSSAPPPPAGRHKTTWRQNSAIRFKPLREMRCNC